MSFGNVSERNSFDRYHAETAPQAGILRLIKTYRRRPRPGRRNGLLARNYRPLSKSFGFRGAAPEWPPAGSNIPVRRLGRVGAMPELQRLHADHAPAVLAFERANRGYFAAFISDRGDDFFDQFA